MAGYAGFLPATRGDVVMDPMGSFLPIERPLGNRLGSFLPEERPLGNLGFVDVLTTGLNIASQGWNAYNDYVGQQAASEALELQKLQAQLVAQQQAQAAAAAAQLAAQQEAARQQAIERERQMLAQQQAMQAAQAAQAAAKGGSSTPYLIAGGVAVAAAIGFFALRGSKANRNGKNRNGKKRKA